MSVSLPEGGPAWFTGVAFVFSVVLYFVTRLAETSESFQKLLGPLGRRIATRADRRLERERAVRADRREQRDEKVADLTRTVDHLKVRLDELVELDEYVVYVITWVRTLRVWAAEHDVTLPPPELLTFEEWRPIHVYQGGISS